MPVPGPTERLTFREVTLDDLDLVERQLGDPRVMWTVPTPWRREQCRAFIEDSERRWTTRSRRAPRRGRCIS
jgi:RimJ/RimL family protein N-acetyltransferase